jgi:dolichyl-phosphate-mannose-protein mannosyltransferase
MAATRKGMPTQKGSPLAVQRSVDDSLVQSKQKKKSYASEGVQDNDIFLLPISDYQIMLALTAVAAVVRLFRIYQPTSVVFDEVQ